MFAGGLLMGGGQGSQGRNTPCQHRPVIPIAREAERRGLAAQSHSTAKNTPGLHASWGSSNGARRVPGEGGAEEAATGAIHAVTGEGVPQLPHLSHPAPPTSSSCPAAWLLLAERNKHLHLCGAAAAAVRGMRLPLWLVAAQCNVHTRSAAERVQAHCLGGGDLRGQGHMQVRLQTKQVGKT